MNKETKRNTLVFKCIVPVVGVPFCTQTRIVKTCEIMQISPELIVIEVDTKTIDAPYSDSFSCKESFVSVNIEGGNQ
jgi:hypothetical protein